MAGLALLLLGSAVAAQLGGDILPSGALSKSVMGKKRLASRNNKIVYTPGTEAAAAASSRGTGANITTPRRGRRADSMGDHDTPCAYTGAQQDRIANALGQTGDSRHEFVGDGGLTMQWIGVGDSNIEANSKIMVLISATNNEVVSTTNLFVSEDYGASFPLAANIDEMLISSTFSEVPSNSGAYLAFGVPLRAASTHSDEPHLWISTNNGGDWSRVRITVRERENVWFETLVPNPTNADQFLASDSDSNAYLCSGAEQAATSNEIRVLLKSYIYQNYMYLLERLEYYGVALGPAHVSRRVN
jgi:hypothetical protein